MKVLLDECLPVDFRHNFPSHDAHTVEWAGLKGRKNGELLRLAEAAGHDVLLTVDRGIPHQHPLSGRTLLIVMISARTNQVEDLLSTVDAILRVLTEIQPGQIVSIPLSG